jgi:hypothetical protein
MILVLYYSHNCFYFNFYSLSLISKSKQLLGLQLVNFIILFIIIFYFREKKLNLLALENLIEVKENIQDLTYMLFII